MKLFQKNVGKTDRIVRFVLGLILFAAGAFYLGSPLAYAAYFIGLILIATGALGTCALYSLLNFNTLEPGEGCKCKEKEGEPCECAPECKVCNEEVPAKPASAAKEELSVDIPEEAEKKPEPFVPYSAPMAARALLEKEPAAPKSAPKAKKAPARKAAAKKAKPAKKKKK